MHARTPLALLLLAVAGLSACGGSGNDADLAARGRDVFRFDTFGDEARWTDTLRMHEVIARQVSPRVALSVGLKVDAHALPPAVK